MKFSVLSYNIHKGFSPTNRRFLLSKIRNAIRSVKPDLVLLQEVQGEHQTHELYVDDWPGESQFEYLADEIWPHYAYGKNAVYEQGHHGNAILSKFPIEAWENIDISQNSMAKRGILHATLNVEGTRLHALCLHLDLIKSDRDAQVEKLARRIDAHVDHREAIIIGGDFNDWSVAASKQLQNRLEVREAYYAIHGKHARTFPATLPALKLDRIYFRGLQAKSSKCFSKKPWSSLSDHLALFAEFEF